MHPENTPAPDPTELQFAQIVRQNYGPQVPQWQAPPPRRSRWGRWLAILAGSVALICLAGVAVAIQVTPWMLSHRPIQAGPATPSVSAKPSPARSPVEGDPLSVRSAWALEKVRETLGRQRDALVAGDESAYFGTADAAMSRTDRDGLLREFRSLRAMQVADMRDEVDAAFERGTDTWSVDLKTTACFVTRECARGPALAKTIWRVRGGTATLVSWTPDEEIQPWQASELVAGAGQRTVVATTRAYAAKIPLLVQEAEKAAKVADRFARDGKPPARYVIYYAGKKEWQQWFGASPPDWSGGVAIDVGIDRYELMLNGDQLYRTELDDLLRHEMTHASTLPGKYVGRANWWLVEGIAEYAAMDGLPASAHSGDASARALIEGGTITGIEVTGPDHDSVDEEVHGRYAVAYLAMRCMGERFGEAKMVTFFHLVVHDFSSASQASSQVYGVEWASLRSECFGYVKQTLG